MTDLPRGGDPRKGKDEGLIGSDKRVYGTRFEEDRLEQYKLYVSGIEKISDRRQATHSYFLTLNTLLITIAGLLLKDRAVADVFQNSYFLVTCALGFFTSLPWYYLTVGYRQLNTGKFKVLHELEAQMPLALYRYEWKVLGYGEDKSKYVPFSHVELWIPRIFALLFMLPLLAFLIRVFYK